MTSKLSHLKHVPICVPEHCGDLFAHHTLASTACVAALGTESNVKALNPDEALPPVAFLLGWDSRPTVEILNIRPEEAKDHLTRHNLAKAIQQKILSFRRAGRESYGFAIVYSASLTFRQSEIIATIETPEPVECACLEVMWQDERRFLLAEIVRPKDSAPHLNGWHLFETQDKGAIWHEVGPVLAPIAFAEAILLGFEEPEAPNE